MKSEEEYQWVKREKTTKLQQKDADSHLYLAVKKLVMTEEPVQKNETTYGQWNITAIP